MKFLSALPRRIRKRIRNFVLSLWNGFLGIGYTILLPIAILSAFILILVLTVLFTGGSK